MSACGLAFLLALSPTAFAQGGSCNQIDAGVCAESIAAPAAPLAPGDVSRSFGVATVGGTPVGLVNTNDGSSTPFVLTEISNDAVYRMDAAGNLGPE
ncbi:MAG: hypothetical protein AAFQ43_07920, partial [Bacteroidota bacterium]